MAIQLLLKHPFIITGLVYYHNLRINENHVWLVKSQRSRLILDSDPFGDQKDGTLLSIGGGMLILFYHSRGW